MFTLIRYGRNGRGSRPNRQESSLALGAVCLTGAVEFPFDWASGSTAVVAAAILGAVVLIFTLTCYRAWRRRRTAAAGSGAQPGVAGASAEPDLTGREREFLDAEKADANALGWPAAAADGVAASARPQVSGEPDAASRPAKTILIADDDPVVVLALKRRLQQLGFQVLRSPDSAHALMGAMKTRPDLVILDVNMPGGNGLAVCEMLASDPHYAGIPVIIHTSLADTATKQRCQQLGARYVEKSPQSWAEIGSHVETLIGGAGSETKMAGPAPVEAAAQHTLPVCGRVRVLCIDGPKGELESVQRELAALGVGAVRASGLEQGYWTCFTEKPHVLVIHTDTPKKELREALLRLAQHPGTRKLPILLIMDKPFKTTELPHAENLKVLEGSIGWEGLLHELKNLIPIVDADNSDPLADPAHPDKRSDHQDGQAADACDPLSQPEVREKPLRILCIDDDPVIVKSIALRLEPYGIEVKGSENGMEGFFLGLREKPDLILLDLKMPNGEGNYVLGRFKDHSRTKDIPIVILTCETNPGVRREMFSLGAAGFLSKPVRWKAFLAELGRHVQLPRQLIRDYSLSEEELLMPL
jgi:CheY-like chemotaxis protein